MVPENAITSSGNQTHQYHARTHIPASSSSHMTEHATHPTRIPHHPRTNHTEVIINRRCGEMVLLGGSVMAPGVVAVGRRAAVGEPVSILADVDGR